MVQHAESTFFWAAWLAVMVFPLPGRVQDLISVGGHLGLPDMCRLTSLKGLTVTPGNADLCGPVPQGLPAVDAFPRDSRLSLSLGYCARDNHLGAGAIAGGCHESMAMLAAVMTAFMSLFCKQHKGLGTMP